MSMQEVLKKATPYGKYLPLMKAGYDWLSGGVPQRADHMSAGEKKYVNWLQSRSKVGLGQDVMNQQLSAGGRQASNQGDIAKVNVMGQAIGQGLENSGVVAEQKVGVDNAQVVAMANLARNIAEKNRQVKDSATTALGEYGIRKTDQEYNEAINKYNVRNEAANTIVGGISELAQGHMKKLSNKAKLEALKNSPFWAQLSEEKRAEIMAELGGL